jgi:hypothetical protein
MLCVIDSTTLLRRLGSHGSGPGDLSAPFGLRFTSDESYLLVADGDNNRACRNVARHLAFRTLHHPKLLHHDTCPRTAFCRP